MVEYTHNLSGGLLLSVIIVGTGCAPTPSLRKVTEEALAYRASGNFEGARSVYRAHQQYRLSKSRDALRENPYFYSLIIGDLYLDEGNDKASRASYEEALQHGVDDHLVTDRLLRLGAWYCEKSRFQEALDLLTTYRARNPLLFDAALDTASRALTQSEEGVSEESLQQPPP